jgi:hypothetical protein
MREGRARLDSDGGVRAVMLVLLVVDVKGDTVDRIDARLRASWAVDGVRGGRDDRRRVSEDNWLEWRFSQYKGVAYDVDGGWRAVG